MPRLERDPGLDICPDFASPHYGPLCNLLTNAGATEEEALTRLTESWNQENQVRREAWEHQVKEDQWVADKVDHLARELEQDELDTACCECENKRPKINDFDANSLVGSYITPRPSTYAINKLESFDYIKLFYFTREGCLDAQSNLCTEADDAYGLSKIGNFVSFRSISAVRASRNAIQDIDLTWAQMTYAKTSYLQHLGNAGWPKKHIDALAHCFIALEASSFHGCTHGEKILIIYQACIRRHWHDWLKQEGDGGFNIAIIDLGLLETISNEVWDAVHTENKREVSPPCSLFPIQACHANNATHLFPSPHLLLPPLIMLHPRSSCHTGTLHLVGYTWLMLHPCPILPLACMLHMGLSCHTPLFSFHIFSLKTNPCLLCHTCKIYDAYCTLPSHHLSFVSTLYIHTPCTMAYLTDAIHP
jgi:hypothetical protein